MRRLIFSLAAAALLLAAVPCRAGIHYKSVQKTSSEGPHARSSEIQAEGWVAGDKAKVVFVESNGNPVLRQGAYILTRDGGKTVYLVNPEDKTYARWDLQGMLGMAGAMMNGMGPMLKFEFSEPKTQKISEEDGGLVAGVPTRHYKYRTSYAMTVKIFGRGHTTDVVSEQDVWAATTRPNDAALGVWLRAEPPRTGNEEFDKLLASSAEKFKGFPMKVVTVSTSTQEKGNRQTVTRSTLEVTQFDANASVPASAFEIPAGYKETQIAPTQQGSGR